MIRKLKGAADTTCPPSTAPLNKGVACPLIKTTTPAPNTLGYVWVMLEVLSRYRASAMRGFISGAKRTSQGTTVEGMIQQFAEISI
jgi:hypothetical protein